VPRVTREPPRLFRNALVVRQDAARTVGRADVRVEGGRFAHVGPDAPREGAEEIDASGFALVPGFVNTHTHVAMSLLRGLVDDRDLGKFLERLFAVDARRTEEDVEAGAAAGAAEMLLSGTTSFLEAGTIGFLDAVVDGLLEAGIRGRVGRWIWDLPPEPSVYRQTTNEAIGRLEGELARYGRGELVQAWPMVVGHTTCSDELWRAASGLATAHGTGLNFHMSPAAMDPEFFLATFGERPMVHLDRLGVLGDRTVMAHCVHVDDAEIDVIAHRGASVAHCPTTALKVAYGVTQIGKVPEMLARGINVTIGTDGNNAANSSDMYRAAYLVAGLYKDARRDPTQVPAEVAYEMATLNGARALGLEREIGSIEVGKRADLVLHDRSRPEWTPLFNVANQLVYSADGRGVHTVFVEGRRVVDAYRLTTLDTGELYERAQRAGEAVVRRAGLPDRAKWPVRGVAAAR
jgi:5-methylthioadenosine/S-adenosylhomocysteine deaminase